MSYDHADNMAWTRITSEWGATVPPVSIDATGVVCPNCGGAASMDRVSNRIFGWHDRCGWQASLRVTRRSGRTALEDWR
jgi:hypothetical protein